MHRRAGLGSLAAAGLLPNREHQPLVGRSATRYASQHLAGVGGPRRPDTGSRTRDRRRGRRTARWPGTPRPTRRRSRVGQPPVVGLASKLEYPTRHHHGDPVSGELTHERVQPFPGGSPATDTPPPGAAPRSPAPAAGSASSASRSSAASCVAPGRTPSSRSAAASQFVNDSQIPKSVAICLRVTLGSRRRATATTSSRNSCGKGLGTSTSFQRPLSATQLRCHLSVQQTRLSSLRGGGRLTGPDVSRGSPTPRLAGSPPVTLGQARMTADASVPEDSWADAG